MFKWALIFAVVTVVAALLGFGDIAGALPASPSSCSSSDWRSWQFFLLLGLLCREESDLI